MKNQTLWLVGGAGIIVLYIYLKGRGSTAAVNAATGSSIANARNSPLARITAGVGNVVPPLTPNEPGTSAIINTTGGYQYT
jgi:hypothetical protein